MVLTRNEERALPNALASLPSQMRVLVVDALSSDATAAIARAAGASVIERPWTNFVEARRYALGQVRTPWVLMLDADEVLDPELRAAILAAPEDVDGYTVARTTFFCGKPLRMWRGERLLRLFRNGRASLEAAAAAGGPAPLHERWRIAGTVRALPGALLHYSYPNRESYRRKFAAYTALEARETQSSWMRWAYEALKGLARLFWLVFVRAEILDGPRGLYVAAYSAMYRAAVHWKALRGA